MSTDLHKIAAPTYRKGIAYWQSLADAEALAAALRDAGRFPAARVVPYQVGFAVQYRISGPYFPRDGVMRAAILTCAAIAAALWALAGAQTGPTHTCALPCAIDAHGLAEDEVGFDYRHGGTAYLYRVTP